MIRIVMTLTVLMLFSSCGNQQGEKTSTVEIPNGNKDSIIEVNNDRKVVKTTSNDRSQWTDLDFLNQDSTYSSVAEDSIIGIGIVTISDTVDIYDKKLSIYSASGKVITTVERQESDVITIYKGKTYNRDDSLNPFSPRLYMTNPDYFRLVFDCIEVDNEFYTVIINRQTGETAKIKRRDKFFKFETIEEFVNNWIVLGFDFDRSTNPLRKSPSDKSENINNAKLTKYKIWRAGKISIKGDWIEIIIEDEEEKGWIRWRKGNQILIRLYYAC